ncbi:MAG: aminopeptidase P family protein [Candidatus Stahlbacteria bacterium]|nr:MAG: aminopeptidase P family protein [Candidatus Stahlbacteria bacterium]
MAFGKYAVDYEERINYDRLRKERVQRVKKQMEKDGIGALISFDHANIRYLTSYYVTTPMRNLESQLTFIARTGEPYLFGGGTPSETERRMPWLEGRVKPGISPPKIFAKDSSHLLVKMFIKEIIRLMKAHGVEKEPLGIDGTTLQMIYAEAFTKKGIKVVHGKPTLDEARWIKTKDEIELMRITCANSEKAFADIVDAIKPGIRECDLVGIGIKALYEQGDDHTEDLVCCSGYNTNPYGWSFTDKPIRPGDLIYIDVDGASYQGYMSCVYRTFCCGKATQEQKDLYEECYNMLYSAINAVKAGNTTYDVAEKWPDSPKYWGYDSWGEVLPYAVGHGLGLTLHDPPGISRVVMNVGLPAIELKEGMVIALETYAGKRGGKDGVRLEEDVLVTKNGCEILTRWPIEELMECWIPYK